MSTNLGSLEAQRIMKERQRDADRLAQQAREERILRSEPPRFFEVMASCLQEIVKSFNLEMSLEGEDALTFEHSDNVIIIGKRQNPFLLRKVIYFQNSNEVIVRTQIIDKYHNNVEEEKWYFDVKHGELRLNCKNLLECADLLFARIPDAFR